MSDILERILAVKAEEVLRSKAITPLAALRDAARLEPPARDFVAALRDKVRAGKPAVIAEVKKRAPAAAYCVKPSIRQKSPALTARHGAACLSVLTDAPFFQGKPEHLKLAREAAGIPALRKDFIADEYQLYEARALGADCVLLIAAALDEGRLRAFERLARELGMAVLVEVHDGAELDIALKLETPLVGINNRDLHTFATRLETTLDLLPRVPPGRIVITESGILTRDDVAQMRRHGVEAFLIGEAFMRAPDPGSALEDLFLSS